MEAIKTNGFMELSFDEMNAVDGGLLLTTAGMIIGAKAGKAIAAKYIHKSVASRIAGGVAGMGLFGGAGLAADTAIVKYAVNRYR